jgi:hypothetical protein
MKPYMKIPTPPDYQNLCRRLNGQVRFSQIVNEHIKIMTRTDEE